MTNLPIFTEQIMLAIPKKHPLATQPTVTVADIQSLPLIMLATNSPLRRTIDEAFEAKKIALTIGSTTDDPATLRSLINQGLGITFFPQLT
ncbi:LysR family transcriptional regulator substrate-binding protein [Enterococcus sp.]|uniref:LysR family transcriptional regulator substrate-binding protein n=1 Tax=Enterococcus sp. TaxID=35783 RepID=UPI0028A76282|nr:LysR family transcriptional regulator substrate-binding protein [Enterococcus sp.]